MRNTSLLLLVLLFFLVGCTNDDDQLEPATTNPNPPVASDGQYFNLKVNGYELPFDVTQLYGVNTVALYKSGTQFALGIKTAGGRIDVRFDENGKIINSRYFHEWVMNTNVSYFNYPHFPRHYFDLQILSHDVENQRMKVAFSGKLYLDSSDLNSETFDIDACEFDLVYQIRSLASDMYHHGFMYNCSAKFNGNSWYATQQRMNAFTTDDPYKVEIRFDPNTSPGSFDFTPASTNNRVRLSKFNTATLVYDYYDTTGSVAYTYKEFHGANKYTYVGTFSFTAVNPANPADVIQVTDGKYICYLY